MPKDSEPIIAWLNDAYAMENGLIPILEDHSRDAERHPAATYPVAEAWPVSTLVNTPPLFPADRVLRPIRGC